MDGRARGGVDEEAAAELCESRRKLTSARAYALRLRSEYALAYPNFVPNFPANVPAQFFGFLRAIFVPKFE